MVTTGSKLSLAFYEDHGIFLVKSGQVNSVPSKSEDYSIVINVPVYFKGPVTFKDSVSGIDTSCDCSSSSSSTETETETTSS
jgi:hypothetical protein